MTARAAAFKVMGMNRDLSESAFDSRFAYENMNMRLTSTGSNTTLSLTNERGNRLVDLGSITIPTSNSGDEDYDYIISGIVGMAIGYAVLDDILVVFTTDCTWKDESIEIDDRTVNKVPPVGNDAIYKLVMENGEPHLVDVWIGDLGFDAKHPIETLSNYEAEKVRKVYWVDGLNQMRVINVAGDIYGIDSSHFDFSPGLEGGESVEIERMESSLGTFPSGCVQYFFTYFNKYGQESGIFYASTLLYASPSDRGGRADESCTCYFNVKLSGLSGKYDYVRVYAIHRTSLNTEVAAYIVGEYEIIDSVNDEHTVEFNDYGTSLTALDSSELLFKEHEPIIAGTITRKDQRLFAGNVSLDTRYQLTDEQAEELASCVSVSEGTKELPYVKPEGVYPYKNNLSLGEDAVKGFKGGEWYRVAVQLQSKVGTWTEPVFVGDFQVKAYPRIDNATSYVPCLKVTLTSVPDWMDGYIAIRAMLADPLDGYKSIMCQGLLCPTMYNTRNRYDNAPHAVSSWFMRPIASDDDRDSALHFKHNDYVASSWHSNGEIQCADIEEYPVISDNSTIEYHIDWLRKGDEYVFEVYFINVYEYEEDGVTHEDETKTTIDQLNTDNYDKWKRQLSRYMDEDEIPEKGFKTSGGIVTNASNDYAAMTRANELRRTYYIDQNILTFHSPDINDNTANMLDGNEFSLRIIGIVPITAGYASHDIQSSGSLYNPSRQGSLSVNMDKDNLSDSFFGLISAPLWNDDSIYIGLNSQSVRKGLNRYEGYNYATYPWHRNGSLNDDDSSTKKLNDDDTDTIAQTSVLEKKVFSNLRFSYRPLFLDSPWTFTNGNGAITVYNSEEATTIPIVRDNGTRKLYQGNVDTIVVPWTDYDDNANGLGDEYGIPVDKEGKRDRDGYLIMYSGALLDDDFNGKIYTPLINNPDHNEYNFIVGRDPVPIRYKSTPHAVIPILGKEALPAIDINDIRYNTLPELGGLLLEDVSAFDYADIVSIALEGDGSGIYPLDDYFNAEHEGQIIMCIRDDAYLSGNFIKVVHTTNEATGLEVYAAEYLEYKIGDILFITGRNTIEDANGNLLSGFVQVVSLDEEIGFVKVYGLANCEDSGMYPNQGYIGSIACDDPFSGFLYLAELYRTSEEDMNLAIYGQQTKEALRLNTWTVNSEAVSIAEGANMSMMGDTFFGRWDCLKTYAFSTEDKNQVVDITSFMVESSINLDGRTDRNRGVKDNTVMSSTNFNLFNTVYDQKDNYFTYNITDNTITQYEFPNAIIWSQLKTNGELVDTWTAILMASYLDMDGGCGKVTSLNRVDNNVICFQENATAQILYNETMQMTTTDGVPVEIANSGAVNGKRYLSDSIGVFNKWAVAETSMGIYFVDDFGRTLNILGADMKITCICDGAGFHSWYHEALETPTVWNPVDFGMTLQYDETNQDLLTITGSDCLAFSERMGAFSSFYSYGWTPYFANIRGKLLTLHPTDGGTEIYIQNEGEYNEFFGELHGYGTTVIVNGNDVSDYASKSSFRTDKTFNTVEFRADSWVNGEVDHDLTFDMLKVWNEYQHAEMMLDKRRGYPSPLKKKFRVWRAIIPRDQSDNQYGRRGNRIRNPWAYVSLEKCNPGYEMTVLHDIVVGYVE